MATYKPAAPFNVAMKILVPSYSSAYGAKKKTYPNIENGTLVYGSFKTYGGTEREVNGIYSIEDTATIECWYRPDITSDCRIAVIQTGAIYDVLGEPENINMRNQYLKFKVRRVTGGV